MEPSRAPETKSDRQPFNPYHKWLGILDSQTPPNHYRLLGLELWETDEDVIREAYSRQMNHVKHFWIGPHRDLCQGILDELLAARDTLLDAQLRRPYDRWLKLVRNEANAESLATSSSPRQPFAVHAAPAASIIAPPPTEVTCTRCGAENTSSRKFCANCGDPLWEQCIECNSPCGPGDAHCGGCGVNLAGAVQRRLEEFENRLTHATELLKQRDFDVAIEVLEEALLHYHPRLAGFRNRAEQMIAQSRAEIERLDQLAKTAVNDAEQLLAKGEFQRAAAIFDELPQHLISEPMKTVLEKIRERRMQALAMEKEIREALKEKRVSGLLAKVDQLLKVQPNHADALKLREQLNTLESDKIKTQRTELCNSAKLAVQRRDYAEATKLLEQIPYDYRTPEITEYLEKVSLRAEEIKWLKRDLRDAVVYDEYLLPLAQRLQKLQPEDPSANKFADAAQKYAGLTFAERATASFSWPKFPEAGNSKFPFKLMSGFQGIQVPEHNSPIVDYPERFGIAVGLALQGLELGTLSINLAPSEEVGILSILKPKRTLTSAWGIDLGRTFLKAVKLTIQPASETLVVLEAILIPTQANANESAFEINAKMQVAMAAFLDQANLDGSAICVSLPAEKVILRLVDLPANNQGKVDEIMQYEIKQQIPIPLDTVAWDYEVLESADINGNAESPAEQKVAVIGAKLEDVETQLQLLTDRGIKVDVVQSDGAALYNFLAHQFSVISQQTVPSQQELPVLALADMGSGSTNLVLTDGRVPFVRSIHLGSNDFTRSLLKQNSLTWADAEALKQSPSKATYVHQVYEAFDGNFQRLATELQRSVDQYLIQDSRRTLQHIFPLGNGWKLHGLLTFLSRGH